MSDSQPAAVEVTERALPVRHVVLSSDKPYADVKRALEARVGRLSPEIRQLLTDGRIGELRAELTRIAGDDGLAMHYLAPHGEWLALKEATRELTAYLIGNVLLAVEMTAVHPGAGLYAPLRVVLYGTPDGGSVFEYDLPSTLFGQYGEPRVDEIAALLDRRIEALLRAVAS